MVRLTSAGTAVGTAAYMSPEQAAGEDVDARSDLWSLGVVVREMLTGRPPFEGSNALAVIHAVQTATPGADPIAAARCGTGAGGDRVAHDGARPQQRTITAGEVRDLAASCHGAADVRRHRRSRSCAASRRRAWIAAAVIMLCVLGGATAWWVHGTRRCAGHASRRCRRSSGWPAPTNSTRRFVWRRRRSSTSPMTRCSPSSYGRSRERRQSNRCRRARRCSTGRTDARNNHGGRSGRTPIENASVPRGLLHWKAELAGYDVAEDVGPGPFWPPAFHFGLVPAGHGASRDGPDRLVGPAVSDCSFPDSITCRRSASRLLDRPARGHQPRLQAFRRRWRYAGRSCGGSRS